MKTRIRSSLTLTTSALPFLALPMLFAACSHASRPAGLRPRPLNSSVSHDIAAGDTTAGSVRLTSRDLRTPPDGTSIDATGVNRDGLAPGAAERHVEVRRFQWRPVTVYVGAEQPHGVELFVSNGDRWALTWIAPGALESWLPTMDSVVRRRRDATAAEGELSTLPLHGRHGSEIRLVSGTIGRQRVYGLKVSAPTTGDRPLIVWMTEGYTRDLERALRKAAEVTRTLAQTTPPATADAAVDTTYEPWEVDQAPVAPDNQTMFGVVPNYSLGGQVTLSFVVDSTGSVLPRTITLLDSEDATLGRNFAQRFLPGSKFEPGRIAGRAVRTRTVQTFELQSESRFIVSP
jgi:hypothetical protein